MILLLWAFYKMLKETGCLPKKSVKNQHVFITGAGSGLGRIMAQKFVRLGSKITICDINQKGLNETVEMIQKERGSTAMVNAQTLDVTNRQGIRDIAKQCVEHFGEVDILLNNAGIVQGKSILEMNENLTSKTMIINCECHFWLVREFLPAMMRRNNGHVVSIASMAGICSQPGLSDYCASKFAAVGFNEALRLEMKQSRRNIVCTTVCPMFINTGMFSGVKTSNILPMLNQEDVVRRIMIAILQNEEMVHIPWYIGPIASFGKTWFSAHYFDLLNKFMCGGWDSMDNWEGRG